MLLPPRLMRLNVSSVKLYQTCPRKWWYSVEGHTEAETEAQRDGILWHKCVELMEAPPAEAPAWMRASFTSLVRWYEEHPEVEIIASEVELEAPFGKHTLTGRLDRVVRWNGSYWHWQNKSVAQGRNPALYIRLLGRSFHENAYGFLARPHFSPYGGSIIALARKLSQAALARQSDPLVVEPVPTRHYNDMMLKDLERLMDQMQSEAERVQAAAVWERPYLPPQNPDACGGMYGNSACYMLEECESGRMGPLAAASRPVALRLR